MNHFRAVNDKQLGICLRMLYAEKLQGFVEVIKNDKNKIEFHVKADVDEDYMKLLLERYEILIS